MLTHHDMNAYINHESGTFVLGSVENKFLQNKTNLTLQVNGKTYNIPYTAYEVDEQDDADESVIFIRSFWFIINHIDPFDLVEINIFPDDEGKPVTVKKNIWEELNPEEAERNREIAKKYKDMPLKRRLGSGK